MAKDAGGGMVAEELLAPVSRLPRGADARRELGRGERAKIEDSRHSGGRIADPPDRRPNQESLSPLGGERGG